MLSAKELEQLALKNGKTPYKTVLPNKILLFVLKYGLWTKVYFHGEKDEEFIHYRVISFDKDKLLICFSRIGWGSGETSHTPHIIYQKDLGKFWFLTNPEEKEEK